VRHLVVGAALMWAVLWNAGCGAPLTTGPSVTTTPEGGETQAQAGIVAAQRGNALVRLVNADPGEKGVDLIRDDGKLFSDVPYKGVTAYAEAPKGRNVIKLRSADGTENLSASHRELVPGRHYTLVALPKEKGGTRLSIFRDDLSLLEAGETRVRLINATADVDDLDLFIAGARNHVLHGIDAGTVTTTSFADMEAGTVEIRSPNRPAPSRVAQFKVEADRLYTFVVTGTASKLEVVQIVDRTGP